MYRSDCGIHTVEANIESNVVWNPCSGSDTSIETNTIMNISVKSDNIISLRKSFNQYLMNKHTFRVNLYGSHV